MKKNSEKPGKLYPNPLEQKFERVTTPFHEFIRNQTTGSILLIICTITALIIANSPLARDYQILIETYMVLIFGDETFQMTVRHWVNDGLMVLFFFVLGLEIKREILVGELSNRQQSFPVIAAALGGMLVPAMIYFAFNAGLPSAHGWGIPTATDTAFAVGMLALLGRRIPIALITFLTALAIIDDLGAILVIAIFYTDTISLSYLALAGSLLLLLVSCNLFGCRRPMIYLIGGLLVWVTILASGIHATVAGILVAFTIPARPKRDPQWFVRRTRNLINQFENMENQSKRPILGAEEQHQVVEWVHDNAKMASTPLRRWEHALETPVALFVMPIFALVNAGIPLSLDTFTKIWSDRLSLGIILGLVLGKSIGISLLAWLALKLNLGRLPQGVNMYHIIGVGLLGGMGFTMSIFIASLGVTDTETLVAAKTAILLASLAAGISGYTWLRIHSTPSAKTA